jgi:hypothetical protein
MCQFQESIRPKDGIPAGLQSNWERRRYAWEHLGAQATNLVALATSLGAPRIPAKQSGKIVGKAAGVPGNHSNYLSFDDF